MKRLIILLTSILMLLLQTCSCPGFTREVFLIAIIPERNTLTIPHQQNQKKMAHNQNLRETASTVQTNSQTRQQAGNSETQSRLIKQCFVIKNGCEAAIEKEGMHLCDQINGLLPQELILYTMTEL